MRAPRLHWLALCMAMVASFVAPPARAHDPYETWTSAIVRVDVLEVVVSMNQGTALQLIDPGHKIGGVSFENFSQLQPQFEKEAASLYILTSAKKPLKPQTVEVTLTDENDIIFKLLYPRPAPGPLHFHAAFVRKLGEGYGGIIEAADTSGNHLGWEQLSFQNPNLEVTVLPPAPAKKAPAPAAK